LKIVSSLFDGRINAQNYLLEMNAREYLAVAKNILDSNEFQRRRVKSANSVYSLLKKDFLRGCVLPPIVLGLNSKLDVNPSVEIDKVIDSNIDDVVILDGLQRTYSLIELEQELKEDAEELEKFYLLPLRVEMYVSINRLGVLYRMLTLNTGQSPMSIRQQIEMLYLDYVKKPFDGIVLLREVDDDAPSAVGEYTFKSVADGFNSYIERNELPIDRGDILENIRGLEKLSTEESEANLFGGYIETYDLFVKKYSSLLGDRQFTSEGLNISGQPFGKNVFKIFSKSQPMTGYGAAMGKLKDISSNNNFDTVRATIDGLFSSREIGETTEMLLLRLEKIRLHSKKIGNAQRLFFVYYFRELLNPESESYRDLAKAVEEGYRKYETQVM
jgi:hypothetical protein